jgi:hypothetical protein
MNHSLDCSGPCPPQGERESGRADDMKYLPIRNPQSAFRNRVNPQSAIRNRR